MNVQRRLLYRYLVLGLLNKSVIGEHVKVFVDVGKWSGLDGLIALGHLMLVVLVVAYRVLILKILTFLSFEIRIVLLMAVFLS